MIKVIIKKDKYDNIIEFEISGHSKYATHGSDIICASVSSMSGCAVVGLTQVLCIKPKIVQGDGYLKCSIPSELNNDLIEKCNIILKSMYLGLAQVATQYPKYVTVSEEV